MGGHCDDNTTGGRWTADEASKHINFLEMLAAFFGLKSLCAHAEKCHIRLEMDNSTAVKYVNAMGGTVSSSCNGMAKNIWGWAIDRGIWLSANYIPGIENDVADKASRVFNDRIEWSLEQRVFTKILHVLSVSPDMDLFASRLNWKLPRYVAWQPDPDAVHVDAFALCWTHINAYMFPPFSLISQCLQKIALEEARGVIVVPLWPTQCWFTELMTLLVAHPLLLPLNCITSPLDTTSQPPPKLRLIACNISGKSLDGKDFRRTLPTLSSPAGKMEHRSNMMLSLKNGAPIAVAGKGVVLKSLFR